VKTKKPTHWPTSCSCSTSTFNLLSQYASIPSNGAYCYTELAISYQG